jgi:NAD(P)-dependent dehydrogenase (short-subunit alcohol dehydrogenase family)
MERLKEKVAIITGGAGGIGAATAKLFLKEGANVMLVDVEEEQLIKVASSLSSDKVGYCVADVSKMKDTKNYIEETLDAFGKIDILFNNAGIEGKFCKLVDYPEKVFDDIIAVNLKGVWLGCQQVVPKMEDGGSVIITSSVAGLKGFQGFGAYSASKHGVNGIMKVAALEFADRKIRVNSIHPGPVNNRMMRSIEGQISPETPTDAKQNFENMVPFGRYAENEEIGNVAVYLASDDSRYLTGTMHIVDGGMMLV